MSMYDEFEIQKLPSVLQKLAFKKKKNNSQTSSGSSEARVGGTGYLQKNGGLCCGQRIQPLWGQVYGAQVQLSHDKKKWPYFPYKILVGVLGILIMVCCNPHITG